MMHYYSLSVVQSVMSRADSKNRWWRLIRAYFNGYVLAKTINKISILYCEFCHLSPAGAGAAAFQQSRTQYVIPVCECEKLCARTVEWLRQRGWQNPILVPSETSSPQRIGPVDFWSRILPVKLSFASIIQARGFIIASSGLGKDGWEVLDTFFPPPVEANTGAHIDIFLGIYQKFRNSTIVTRLFATAKIMHICDETDITGSVTHNLDPSAVWPKR